MGIDPKTCNRCHEPKHLDDYYRYGKGAEEAIKVISDYLGIEQ